MSSSEYDGYMDGELERCIGDFEWLAEGGRSVSTGADSAWILHSPMPELSQWKVDQVAAEPDPAPAENGPRLLVLDHWTNDFTCFYPLRYGAHELFPAVGDPPAIPYVVGAFEFGISPGDWSVGKPATSFARHKAFYTAGDFVPAVSHMLDEHGGQVHGIEQELFDIGRGDHVQPDTNDTDAFWTASATREQKARYELARNLMDDKLLELYEQRKAAGMSEFDAKWTEYLDRLGFGVRNVEASIKRARKRRDRSANRT